MFHTLRAILSNPKLPIRRRRLLVASLHLAGLPLAPFLSLRRRLRRPATISRILLLRGDEIGDFVMTTPILGPLRERFPNAEMDLLCKPATAQLAALFAAELTRVIPVVDGARRISSVRREARALRRRRYDMVIDLRGDLHYVWLSWLAGAPERAGFTFSGFDYLLSRAVAAHTQHQVDAGIALARALGAAVVDPRPRLPLRPEHRQFARQWLRGGQQPLIALHLAATRPAKLWPETRYHELACRLVSAVGAEFVLVGGSDDAAANERACDAIGERARSIAGKAALPETVAILERCDLFIGNDSGPAHLAAAVGCPVVVLFGPTSADHFHPKGAPSRILCAKVPCDPRCDQKVCAVPDRHCMRTIMVDDVAGAAMELLASSATREDAPD